MATKKSLRCPVTNLTERQIHYLAASCTNSVAHYPRQANGVRRSLVTRGYLDAHGRLTELGTNAIAGTMLLSDKVKVLLIRVATGGQQPHAPRSSFYRPPQLLAADDGGRR